MSETGTIAHSQIKYRTAQVNGLKIFYREAGDPHLPAILLLHGFPTSSHMFRSLIPQLADRFHVVAPDLPGFGFSDSPDRSRFAYTFENIANTIDAFTESIGLKSYAIYVFDYGAPVGFRLGLKHPNRITALISQNGNANVKLYPKFQEYFKSHQPPLLAIWGKNDPFFLPQGAKAFERDNPHAKIQFLDSGHFALETYAKEIGDAIRAFI